MGASPKLNILIVSQYFPPEPGSTQNRLASLTEHLVRLGHKVAVLTAVPNYPSGVVFPGYRGRSLYRETRHGATVYRTTLYVTTSRALSRRMINYVSFGAMALVCGFFLVRRPNLLIWDSPPLFIGPFARVLAWLKRAPCVMNVADLWPESAVAMGLVSKDALTTRLAERLELWLYRHSDLITGQTQGIVDSISTRVPQVRVQLLPNGVDLDKIRPVGPDPQLARQLGLEGKFVIGYAGILGYAQALDGILQTAALLKDERSVFFAFWGDGPVREQLVQKVQERRLTNVRFYAPRPRRDMPGIIALWKMGLVPLADHPLFSGARPSKMFELMGLGTPILFSGRGEGADIVRRNGCGLVAPPEDPPALAELIRSVVRDPGQLEPLRGNGQRTAREQFDRAAIVSRLARELEAVARRR